MATLTQVRNKANTKLSDIWPKLQTRQDAYFAKHGKYFQLLAGSGLTESGADTAFSVVSPSDEMYVIDIDTAWSETVPFQLEVHEWNGSTKGYRGIVTVMWNGTKYRRERDSANVDSGWYEVIEIKL